MVDLAYLQTGINEVFLGVLNFKNLYFFGTTGHSCCIFGFLNESCILKCFIFSTVSCLGVQFLFNKCFNNHGSPLLSYHA